jgi:small conductance mechanosensitive channel
MNDLVQGFLEGWLGTSHPNMSQWAGVTASRLTLALVIAGLSIFIASRVRHAVRLYFHRTKGDAGLELLLGRGAYLLILVIGLLIILPIIGLSATALFATVGVFGLAISLAVQDVLKNAVAGVYLLVERPFRPGETIKVREFIGTVETVDLRTTTLRSEGELVYIPNAILFSEILINRGQFRPVAKETPQPMPEEPRASGNR